MFCSYLLAPLDCKQIWCRFLVFLYRRKPWPRFYKVRDCLQLHTVFSVQDFIKWGCRILLFDQSPCNYADAHLGLCGACACHGWEGVMGVPCPSNSGHRSSDQRSAWKPRADCHERCRIQSHSRVSVKFFLHASLQTAAFSSDLEESSDISFHIFHQREIVL